MGETVTSWLKRIARLRPLDGLEDGQLVQRALDGEQQAFRILYERTNPRVAATIARITGSSESLDDLVQETYVKAYRALGTFDQSRPFAPWVLQIARNASWSHLRRQRDTIDLSQVRHLRAVDQWETLTARERLSAFRAALERLPDHARDAIVMHDVEGRTLAEIAEELGVSINTVAARVRRARTKISELMEIRPRRSQSAGEQS